MKDRTAPKPGTRNQQSLARAWLAVLTNLKIEHVDHNGMSAWNRESGGQRGRASKGGGAGMCETPLPGTARSICLAGLPPKETGGHELENADTL